MVSDQKLVSLADGTPAYVFHVSGYNPTTDGNIYVVADVNGKRTVYQAAQNGVPDAAWQGFWSAVFNRGAEITRVEVAIVGPRPDLPPGIEDAQPVVSRWTLANIDLGAIAALINVAGNPDRSCDLSGTFDLKQVGKIAMTGRWDPASPNDPIRFDADNIFKTSYAAGFAQLLPKDAIDVGSTMNVAFTPAPEWINRMRLGGGDTRTGGINAGRNFKLVISFPMKLKLDPTKPAFAMTAHVDGLTKIATIELDPGQTWEKPFGVLPVTFSTLAVGTDASFSAITAKASSDMEFIVHSLVDVNMTRTKGASANLKLAIKPSGDFVGGVLNLAGIPADLKDVVPPMLSRIKLSELTIVGDPDRIANGALPAANLKFAIELPNWRYDFDIKAPDVNLGDAKGFSVKIGDQVWPVLRANLDKIAIGVKQPDTRPVEVPAATLQDTPKDASTAGGSFTICNFKLPVTSLKIDASGDATNGYNLDGVIKLPLVGTVDIHGFWNPSDPLTPVKFESRNIFKPIIDQTLGSAIPKDRFEIKDEMFITIGLDGSAVSALQTNSAHDATSVNYAGGSGDLLSFKIDIGFPMKLQIDPTQPAFDMVGHIVPLDEMAQLSLDDGQSWDKPFGFIPAKFDALEVGTDPTFTSISIKASGNTDFLGPMAFNMILEIKHEEQPKFAMYLIPSSNNDLVAAILSKTRIPETLKNKMPKITLDKFDASGSFTDIVVKQTLPSAALMFGIDDKLAGHLNVGINIPSLNLREPDKFAIEVGEQLLKNLQNLVVDLPGAVIKNVLNQAAGAAKDPVGSTKKAAEDALNTGKDLGQGALDFAKDPAGGITDVAGGALNAAKDLGTQAFNTVSDKVSAIVTDPLGAAKKEAEKALAAANAALSAANDAVSAVGDFFSDIGSAISDFFGGGGGSKGPSWEEQQAKAAADQKALEAKWAAEAAQHELDRLQKASVAIKMIKDAIEAADPKRPMALEEWSKFDFYWIDGKDVPNAYTLNQADRKYLNDLIDKKLAPMRAAMLASEQASVAQYERDASIQIDSSKTDAEVAAFRAFLKGGPAPSGMIVRKIDLSKIAPDTIAALLRQCDWKLAELKSEPLITGSLTPTYLESWKNHLNGQSVPGLPSIASLGAAQVENLKRFVSYQMTVKVPLEQGRIISLITDIINGNGASAGRPLTKIAALSRYLAGENVVGENFPDISILTQEQKTQLIGEANRMLTLITYAQCDRLVWDLGAKNDVERLRVFRRHVQGARVSGENFPDPSPLSPAQVKSLVAAIDQKIGYSVYVNIGTLIGQLKSDRNGARLELLRSYLLGETIDGENFQDVSTVSSSNLTDLSRQVEWAISSLAYKPLGDVLAQIVAEPDLAKRGLRLTLLKRHLNNDPDPRESFPDASMLDPESRKGLQDQVDYALKVVESIQSGDAEIITRLIRSNILPQILQIKNKLMGRPVANDTLPDFSMLTTPQKQTLMAMCDEYIRSYSANQRGLMDYAIQAAMMKKNLAELRRLKDLIEGKQVQKTPQEDISLLSQDVKDALRDKAEGYIRIFTQ